MEKWKIWNDKEEVARSKKEVKKLVLKQFHKQINFFKYKARGYL